MALKDKYAQLVQYANGNGVTNLSVVEQDSVLYVTCTAPSNQVKDELWKIYESIDPEMRSGDLVLNVTVDQSAVQTYEVKSGDNLSKIASKYSGISWKDIFEANKDTIKDPDKIYPGQVLKIPAGS
jgi:nucleoid-associated protein YgaU